MVLVHGGRVLEGSLFVLKSLFFKRTEREIDKNRERNIASMLISRGKL
jgi:hypothetical protein